jgi:hypothetical protein
MRTHILALLFLLVIGGLTSCDSCQTSPVGTSDALNVIPEDAVFVARANLPVLLEKMDFEQIKNSPQFRESMENLTLQNPILADVLQNTEQSGVDISQAAYSYIQLDPENINEAFSAAVISLTDAASFGQLIQQNAEAGSVEEKEGFTAWKENKTTIVAWNDSYALFGTSQRFLDLDERAKQVLNQENAASIADNKDLRKAFGSSHDISLWFTSNPFADAPQAQLALGLAEFEADALKDNYIHGYIDFEEGKVVGKLLPYLQKGLTKDIDKLFNNELATDFSSYISPNRSLLLLTAALNTDGLNEVLQARTQAKGFLEFGLKRYGLSLTDITSALGGDVLFSTLTNDENRVSGLFATNITNEETFGKLLQAGVEQGVLLQEDESTYAIRQIGFNQGELTISFDDGLARLLVKDGLAFISGDKNLLETMKNGGFAKAEQASSSTWKTMASQIFWATLDLDNINARKMGASFDDDKVSEVKAQAGRNEVDFTIEMIEKTKNSLEVLMGPEEELVQ